MSNVETFEIYGGDCKCTIEHTEEKKQQVYNMIVEYMKDHDCTSGGMYSQSDSCIIDSTELMCNILDNVLEIECDWDGEDC